MVLQSSTPSSGSVTVRVDRGTRDSLDQLARYLGTTMQAVAAHAVEAYRRQVLIDDANAAYARLRADPDAAQEFDQEHELFEQALGDGIEDDPYPV